MIEHLRAMIISDVNRRRSICSLLNTRVAQLQIFFAYYFFTFALFRQRRLVSIEGDRRLEESSAQHANVYHAVGVYTYGICVEDMYRVCLRGIRMHVTLGWSIGVRYIYLISVILNVYGGYIYNYNSLTACFTLLIPYSCLSLRLCVVLVRSLL